MHISIVLSTFVEIKIMAIDKKFIYVCLSECKSIVKVGISYNVATRVGSLKTDEGKSFSLVFHSKSVPLERALEIEKEVNIKFKHNVVKGNEWYNAKPHEIVAFLINELMLEPFEITDIITEYPSWEENSAEYKNCLLFKEVAQIKEKPSKGIFYIRYVSKSEFKYIAFCNFGDAKKFYSANKVFILMADTIMENLYGATLNSIRSLNIHPKKNIYGIRDQIIEVRENLKNLLRLTEI